MNPRFWADQRVFVTGHSGFMGSWLALWLQELGAQVTGYALDPPTDPNLFTLASVGAHMVSHVGDLRDAASLRRAMEASAPGVVFHLAAQPLVRRSYFDPVETYSVNVVGTATVLETIRRVPSVGAIVVVTSDKCYENREWAWAYREGDALGGSDPYSSSKACAELLTQAFRRSYFEGAQDGGPRLASVRAGNVIGGGDWAEDRLIPDFVRARLAGHTLLLRHPNAVRPWQHVLDALSGFLSVAEHLASGSPGEAWNFGPSDEDTWPVCAVIEHLARALGPDPAWDVDPGQHLHEARYLTLDSCRARQVLGWRPRWRLRRAIDETGAWYQAWMSGAEMRAITLAQIRSYLATECPPLPRAT